MPTSHPRIPTVAILVRTLNRLGFIVVIAPVTIRHAPLTSRSRQDGVFFLSFSEYT